MRTEKLENGIMFTGDSRLVGMARGAVQLCITSPPYFQLRDYGTDPLIWGGQAKCNHVWGDVIAGSKRGGSGTPTDKSGRGEGYGRASSRGRFCKRCSAWEGQLGLEPTLDLYVEHLVEVFRRVRNVLHDTGVLWLNLGDSYASDSMKADLANIKTKDLLMVPFRVALALQEDGWYLRSVCPWVKGSCLPESVQDRPTSAIEYWFMFSKSKRYYYDIDAIRLPHTMRPQRRDKARSRDETPRPGHPPQSDLGKPRSEKGVDGHKLGRAPRNSDAFFDSAREFSQEINSFLFKAGRPLIGSEDGESDEIQAFYVNPESFKGAHFATFPTKLIEPMILSCTSAGGGCARCFSPYKRLRRRKGGPQGDHTKFLDDKNIHGKPVSDSSAGAYGKQLSDRYREHGYATYITEGWEKTCDCDVAAVSPQIVYDPFGGSGTVALVCESHGRRWRICDLNPGYVKIAKARILLHCRSLEGLSEQDVLNFQQTLF